MTTTMTTATAIATTMTTGGATAESNDRSLAEESSQSFSVKAPHHSATPQRGSIRRKVCVANSKPKAKSLPKIPAAGDPGRVQLCFLQPEHTSQPTSTTALTATPGHEVFDVPSSYNFPELRDILQLLKGSRLDAVWCRDIRQFRGKWYRSV